MEKINQDFGLGLAGNYKVDKKKIKEMEDERKRKLKQHQLKQKRYNKLIEQFREINFQIDQKLKTINILNWENVVYDISKLQDKAGILESEIDELFEQF